jgi:hypothetical protein
MNTIHIIPYSIIVAGNNMKSFYGKWSLNDFKYFFRQYVNAEFIVISSSKSNSESFTLGEKNIVLTCKKSPYYSFRLNLIDTVDRCELFTHVVLNLFFY